MPTSPAGRDRARRAAGRGAVKAEALALLVALRRRLPDVPPEERWRHGECRRFRDAAVLCVEGRHAEAHAVLTAKSPPPLDLAANRR